MNEESALINEAIRIEQEKAARKKAIDDMCCEAFITVKLLREMLVRVTDEYYAHYYEKPPDELIISKDEVLNDPAIKYLLEPGHVLPEGMKKHSAIFKNLAILFVNTGFCMEEIKDMARKVVANCPGHKAGEIIAWAIHVKESGRTWEFNRAEFNAALAEGREHA